MADPIGNAIFYLDSIGMESEAAALRQLRQDYIALRDRPAALAESERDDRLRSVWSWCIDSAADYTRSTATERATHKAYRSVADHIRTKYYGGCKESKMRNKAMAAQEKAK